eukprot:753607-Hanusia_phi.AAC.3
MWKPGTKGPSTTIERAVDEKCDVIVNKMKHLPISVQRKKLPIYRNRAHILYLLENYRTIIVVGETGSGKSTQIPQYLFEAGWADGGRVVICTQPRRVAAQTLAARVAQEMGVELGKECGYSIRFDNMTDHFRTRVKFMTDGILLREMMSDPLLSRYSVIMVDEAHERGIYSDIAIGLLKKIQRKRKDLRIIVSSATLDAEAFKNFFQGDKPEPGPPPFKDGKLGRVTVMSMEAGRMYPVDIHYLSDPCQDYVKVCVETVNAIHAREPPGDILVFLTGAEEVNYVIQALHAEPVEGAHGLTISACPLYAALAVERQMEAFADTPAGIRKVVVATNIAETSVTIPGIVYVLDCMFVKIKSYNAKLGVDYLTVMPVSAASAVQRSGRAGRVRSGKAYRMCTEKDFRSLPVASIPEMQRSDLVAVILQLKALGVDDVLHFDFPSPPPALSLARALEILYALGALDEDAKLTEPLGLQMAEFPLDPPLAKFLLSSGKAGCSEEALTIAAMFSVQNVFVQDGAADEKSARRHYAVREGDQLTLVNVYNAFESSKRSQQWCQARRVNHRSMTRACDTRKQLAAYVTKLGVPLVSCGRESDVLRRCIAGAFFCNAAKLEADGAYKTIRGEQRVQVHPVSVMHQRGAQWVLYHEVSHRQRRMRRMCLLILLDMFASLLAPAHTIGRR